MDFGRNLLVDAESPTTLSSWTATKASIRKGSDTSYIDVQAGGTLYQEVNSKKISYTPKQYKISVQAETESSVGFFKQAFHAELILIRADGTITNYLAVLSPDVESVSGTYNYSCCLDVAPTPAVTRVLFRMKVVAEVYFERIVLQPSIDIDPSIQDTIQSSLPNLIVKSNSLSMTVREGRSNLAFIKMAMGGSANLILTLFVQGKFERKGSDSASVTFHVLLNNSPRVYSPIIAPVIEDRVLVGCTVPLLQVPSGANTLSIEASASNGTLHILPEQLQVTVSGRNIEGGMSSEPPHAEIRDELAMKDTWPKEHTILDKVGSIVTDSPTADSIHDSVDIPSLCGSMYKEKISEAVGVSIIQEGYVLPVNDSTMEVLPSYVDNSRGYTRIDFHKRGALYTEQALGGSITYGTVETQETKSIEKVVWW